MDRNMAATAADFLELVSQFEAQRVIPPALK
jgi:hypothetical protein